MAKSQSAMKPNMTTLQGQQLSGQNGPAACQGKRDKLATRIQLLQNEYLGKRDKPVIMAKGPPTIIIKRLTDYQRKWNQVGISMCTKYCLSAWRRWVQKKSDLCHCFTQGYCLTWKNGGVMVYLLVLLGDMVARWSGCFILLSCRDIPKGLFSLSPPGLEVMFQAYGIREECIHY